MKNLKPFDLQAALSGKAVMLRDGSKAYVRHHETELPADRDVRLAGFLQSGVQLAWCDDGRYLYASDTSCRDIIGMHPETRVINGFEVPAPETKAQNKNTTYYVPAPHVGNLYVARCWYGNSEEFRDLNRGLVFLNKEDAIATAKAMLGIDPYSETES